MTTLTVSTDFVEEALHTRYNQVFELWGNKSHEELFPLLVNHITECGISTKATPMNIVDNFLVNGDIRDKDDYESDEEWQEICNDAIIHSDNHALMQF